MKKAPRSEQFGKKVPPPSADADAEREDPLNPAIPKAPLLPHDLHRMANAALPKWSNPPNDKGGERQPLTSQAEFELLREHVDADPPPGATPSTYDSAARAPHTDSVPHPSAARQASAVAPLKPEVPAAPRPIHGSGAGAAPVIASRDLKPEPSTAASSSHWPIVGVVVLAAIGGLCWLLL
jgi:hypothetical protein